MTARTELREPDTEVQPDGGGSVGNGGDGGDRIVIGDCLLDLAGGTLSRGGRAVDLRAKSFALLAHLARHAGRVVGKDELMDAVWPDVAVTEDSLTQAIRDVRVHLGAAGAAALRTVPRRGYMLDLSAAAPAAEAERTGPPRVRVAILPFADKTGRAIEGPRIEFLCEEVAAGLARFRTFAVLPPQTAAAAWDGGDPLSAARALSADWLVTGTARAAGDGFRLTVGLLAGEDGALAWSETFDCSEAAIIGQADAIPRRIVGHLNASLELRLREQSHYRPTGSLGAFDHFARGLSLMRRGDPSLYPAALSAFQAACDADPAFGFAHSCLAWAELSVNGFGLAPAAVKARAVAHARRGAELSPQESRAVSLLGYALVFAEDYPAAEDCLKAALRLNPWSADTMMDMAVLQISRGRPAEALAWLDRVAEVSPVPMGYEEVLRFEALYHLRDYDGAAEAAARLAHPDIRQRVWMAAIAAMRGRAEEARQHLALVATDEPEWDHLGSARAGYTYEHPEDSAHMLEGISRALEMARG